MWLIKRAKLGFTFFELIIVVAIIGTLAALSMPFVSAFQTRNDLDVAANTLAQTTRRAQSLAMATDLDSQWGVKITNQDIVLFKGASYVARDPSYDEAYSISSNILVSTTTEVVFLKFSGTTAGGTINLANGNDTRTVTINEKGIVSY